MEVEETRVRRVAVRRSKGLADCLGLEFNIALLYEYLFWFQNLQDTLYSICPLPFIDVVFRNSLVVRCVGQF